MLSLYYLITILAQSWEDYIFTSGVVWLIKLHYSDFYTHVQTRLMVGLTAHAPKWLETGKLNPTLKIPRKFLKVFLLVPMYHHYIWATVINWQKLMQTKFPYFLILKLSSNKDLQCPRVLYSTGHVFMLQNLRTSLKWWNCYSWRTKCINHYYFCLLNWRQRSQISTWQLLWIIERCVVTQKCTVLYVMNIELI